MRWTFRVIVFLAATIAMGMGIGPAMAADDSSPRAALKTLEDTYTARDLDAVIAAKDFCAEAEEMLRPFAVRQGQPWVSDEKSIRIVADALLLAFKKEIEVNGFPDFSAYDCTVVSEAPVRADLVEMVEECIAKSDGSSSLQTLHAVNRGGGWRIILLPPPE